MDLPPVTLPDGERSVLNALAASTDGAMFFDDVHRQVFARRLVMRGAVTASELCPHPDGGSARVYRITESGRDLLLRTEFPTPVPTEDGIR